jgi:hypothetical protein
MGRACSTKGEKRSACRYWWECQKEKGHYKNQDVSEWIILKWILDRMNWYELD